MDTKFQQDTQVKETDPLHTMNGGGFDNDFFDDKKERKPKGKKIKKMRSFYDR